MKITIAQLNYHVGNFEKNLEKIISAVQQAKKENSDIILFSELSICGYPPRDFLEFSDFHTRCKNTIDSIKLYSNDIAIILGAPSLNPTIEGKDLFNSAYFLYDQKILNIFHKTLLPTYDIFDESRYFESNKTFECIEFKGKKLAITICEDLWNVGNENPMYEISPMEELIRQNPDVILNLSASPFSYNHFESRQNMLEANIAKYKIPIFYCNAVGAQTELIFDGGSMVYDGSGKKIDRLDLFKEDIKTYEWRDEKIQVLGSKISNNKNLEDKFERIHEALLLGIKDYFSKLGFKKAVLGLSGGIDSALTCVLAAQALGPENVLAVLLPSQYSSDHSISDAQKLVQNLGCEHEIIPIKPGYEVLETLLKPLFKELPSNITEENLQARIRGVLLMALSNKFGNILLNTSNKSEVAVGYGTLYGDMCGGISVLGDLYKTEVYELANYINKEKIIIPLNSISKAPSAELRPGQKDQDTLPPYEILDIILYQYIECKKAKFHTNAYS